MKEQEEKKPSGGNESRNNDDDASESSNGGDEEAYFDSFPEGYRFKPFDEELVVFYLKRKIMNEPLPRNKIKEVELYKFNPQTLSENWKSYGENEWYFFTPRDRKYKNGERPNRAAGDGYWKATGADKPVKYNGVEVGSRKALVFYKGKPPRGEKTDWIMHEFRVDNSPKRKREENDMRLDDWVLCRLYKKADRSTRGSGRSRDDSVPEEEQEDENQPQHDQDCGNMSVEKDSKMLAPQGNFIPDGLDSFDIYGNYYNQPNQMGLNGFDNNALYVQGSQSSFRRGPQSYYPQLGQTPEVIQHMFPGYQNPNPMVPVPFRPGEIHVKPEHFIEYHSDELLNVPPDGNGFDQFVSEFNGTSNSVVPPFFTDDKKQPTGNCFDQFVSEFSGTSDSVVPPSSNSAVPPFSTDDKNQPTGNGLDQTFSDLREPSNSVLPPSINDDKKQNS